MKPKPRIAVIGLKGLPAFGGAASVGENIIRQLHAEYDFTVYSVSSHTTLQSGNYDGICTQVVFRSIRNRKLNTLIYYLKSLFHALFLGRYDLIHLHHRDAAFIVPLLKIRYPVIITTHGIRLNGISKWERYRWYFDAQLKYFTKFADAITSVSNTDKRILLNNFGLVSEYIPNGIIPSTPNFRAPDDSYIFFAAGRIMHSKGCHLMLDALVSINYRGKVKIAGSLEHESEYSQRLMTSQKYLDIEFLGLIKQKTLLLNLLANARLFIFPSLNESMSMMLLEAVNEGVPIICSDIQPNKDIFSKDEVVFFINNNVYDLAEKILWALSNPDDHYKMARKAYERAINEYNWSIIANKYKQLYRRILMK